MRRKAKLLTFILGHFIIIIYCEFIIYYVSISQCYWPKVTTKLNDNPLHIAIIADVHLLGPRKGHWLDKMRREWQMHRAFQTMVSVKQPEAVFVLGDLFDEGEWSSSNQFNDYVDRFFSLFALPNDIPMFIAVGNHDIGFHRFISYSKYKRFSDKLNSTSVQLVSLKGNHFVLVNSMAMEGDSCRMCTEARELIEEISDILNCSLHSTCADNAKKILYSRPILMQHFPLYRVSDAECTGPDAAPLSERYQLFRRSIDALSKESTEYLIESIRPRAAFGGHTHHGCHLHHQIKKLDLNFDEYSVPSFSWRNRLDPMFMLVTITPENYSVKKCGLPSERAMILSAIFGLILLYIFTYKYKR